MTNIIIDTDIGTDIDDALAVAYAIRAGLDIKLITTVHGNTTIRAKIAQKLTQDLLGITIPLAAGESKPIKQNYIYWTGLEGKDFLTPQDHESTHPIRTDGVDTLIETIEQYKHNITLLSLGPLTNIAKALQRHPSVESSINHIYMMGNAIQCEHTYHLNYRAHNFKVDPEAVDIVMDTKIPKTILTTSVCKKNYLTTDELQSWQSSSDPLLHYLSTAAKTWMNYINYDVAYLYDPLVIHHAIDSMITTTRNYDHVNITTDVNQTFKDIFIKTLEQNKEEINYDK